MPVVKLSNAFLQNEFKIEKNDTELLIPDNPDVLISSFIDFDFLHQTIGVNLTVGNTPSSSTTLRPRILNSTITPNIFRVDPN